MGDIQQILQTSWPILLMVVIFYFLLWRPQKKQQKELKQADNADIYKVKGELLTAYIYMIQKGMKSIEVDNFYDENMAKMTIELNENLTPSENTQKYFKKYNKLKTAKKELTEQMAISKEEIEYLENSDMPGKDKIIKSLRTASSN